MEGSLSVLSTVVRLSERLVDEVKKYQRHKKTKEQLFGALEDEIRTSFNHFEELATIGEELLPLLDSIETTLAVSMVNPIVECTSDIQFTYSKILQDVIKLAKGCKQVSLNEAFMKHLEESSASLHDFVLRMAGLIRRGDSILMDDNFYRFFKLYEDEIFNEIEVGDVDEVSKAFERYIKIIEKKVKPTISRAKIRRRTLRRFNESLKQLNKVRRKVKIQKTMLISPRDYVPSKFLPIIYVVEETYPFKKSDSGTERGRKTWQT